MNPPLPIENLKIQWQIHFLTFLITDRNAQKKILEQLYEHSHLKSAFGTNFRLRKLVKLKIRKYVYLRIVSLTTSRSQKLILKADFK